MRRLKPLGYLLVFVVPATLPAAAWLARATPWPNLAAWFPTFFLFVLLPVADYLCGRDTGNPADDAEAERLERGRYYAALLFAVVPVQFGLLAWSAQQFATLPLNALGIAGWLWAQGVVSGTLAINVAHELIHKRGRVEPWTGGLLLASVCYATFKVEHVRGHHVHVATPADASSAPLGSSVFAFVARALVRNIATAWRLEAARLRRIGLPWWHRDNELVAWTAVSLALAAGFFAWLGAAGLVFFLAQGAIAAAVLEVINYVEHYGLERRLLPDGRYERTTHLHSWNSSYRISNFMLFQLQRHSDHHENPRRRYPALRHYDASPQLPGGYTAMLVLALCPPLWRRVIDPRVRAFRDRRAGDDGAVRPATAFSARNSP